MEKLTLRQFADVIKALVEANMPKEAGFTLKVVESGDKEKADGQKVELVCTKEEKKEDTKKTDSVEAYSSEYCSAEITYDMNADYREYELELAGSAAPQDEILRKIAKRVVYDIVGRVVYDIDGDSKVEKKKAEKVEEKKEDCECQDKDKDDFTDDFDDDDLDDDWDDDENTCECCKKALKAALIGAAVVPLSIMIFKRIRK